MEYIGGKYDIAVVGAGHAGCEAAFASAKLGCKTILFTLNLDSVANMACNPSIGGTAKGHLVREVDALGGMMGKVADETLIQSRMLNRAKGPAVHSLRTQIDRRHYQEAMKLHLENQENLDIKQCEITEVLWNDQNKIIGVKSHTGTIYHAKCVILCTGTFLKSRIIIGENNYPGGPDGLFPANILSDRLQEKGLKMMRFKTGTPARVHQKSMDFTKMAIQKGEKPIIPFSFETDSIQREQIPCYLTYTNQKTHQVIRKNLHRSPLYSGDIKGVGPRYCPSIEDKVVRFKDKERHQIFIEPMGEKTHEMYVQGMSSSLPEDVQENMLKTIEGMENAKVMRAAYAIEYDCFDSLQVMPTLELKDFPGLYAAGQINGSSGYEEAAAQGLIAGINAARKIKKKKPITIDRSTGYIGVLIDDLVTKGTNEPYRMMTSRSEYRLLLRQDNADWRLTPLGHKVGLISEKRYQIFKEKWHYIHEQLDFFKKTIISPKQANPILEKYHSKSIVSGMSLDALLKRPEMKYGYLMEMTDKVKDFPDVIKEQIQISCKYEGYIQKQIDQVKRYKKMENIVLDEQMSYQQIQGLRLEARQKLDQVKPLSLGQASRISGVSPADINVLLIYLEQRKKQKE